MVVQRRYPAARVRNYTVSLQQFRLYLRDEKGIPFDKAGFECFTWQTIYDFCIWLRDTQLRSVNTVNLRLSAIQSFLRYCSEEDAALTGLYISAKAVHRFKGTVTMKLEYLDQSQLASVFAHPDTAAKVGRRNQYFMIHAYETGGRIDELISMTLNDIIQNGNEIQIRLHGKGDKVRYIPFPDEAIPHLNTYLLEFHPHRNRDDFLFYTIHNGEHTKMSTRP